MIEHIWTVICSRAIIDKDSNNVSLQNVLEEFKIFSHPQPDGLLPINYDLITLWIRADEDNPCEANSRFSLISPSGINLFQMEQPVDLTKNERTRNKLRFAGFPATEEGKHYFIVELQTEDGTWNEKKRIPLRLRFQPPETLSSSED